MAEGFVPMSPGLIRPAMGPIVNHYCSASFWIHKYWVFKVFKCLALPSPWRRTMPLPATESLRRTANTRLFKRNSKQDFRYSISPASHHGHKFAFSRWQNILLSAWVAVDGGAIKHQHPSACASPSIMAGPISISVTLQSVVSLGSSDSIFTNLLAESSWSALQSPQSIEGRLKDESSLSNQHRGFAHIALDRSFTRYWTSGWSLLT